MSDLAEIAAAAGIAIIDNNPGDGGDAKVVDTDNSNRPMVTLSIPMESGDSADAAAIQELEAMFSHRYTESDPEYTTTLANVEAASHPPCVTGFNCRRPRDDSRNWNRDNQDRRRYGGGGGDRGGYRNRDNRGDWNRRDGGGGGGWGRSDNRSYDRPRDYGDYHRQSNRDYRDRNNGRDRSPHK